MSYDIRVNNISEREKIWNNIINRTSFMFERERDFDFMRTIRTNMCRMTMHSDVVAQTSKQELKDFIERVLQARIKDVKNTKYPKYGAMFYAWIDEMDAELCMNIFPRWLKHLPFYGNQDHIHELSEPDHIIDQYFNCNTHNGIPADEFVEIDWNTYVEEETYYYVYVYRVDINFDGKIISKGRIR